MLLLRQDSSGRWNQFSGRYAWDTSCICSGNPAYGGTGAEKQGSNFEAAPNIDHTSERVRRVRPRSMIQLSLYMRRKNLIMVLNFHKCGSATWLLGEEMFLQYTLCKSLPVVL